MLAARLATAGVGIPLVVAFVWLDGSLLAALVALTAFETAREAARLLGLTTAAESTVLGMGAAVVAVAGFLGPFLLVAVLGLGLGAILLAALVSESPRSSATATSPAGEGWTRRLAVLVYVGLPLALLSLMRGWVGTPLLLAVPGQTTPLVLPRGAAWVFVALTSTWAVDSAAYVIGRRFGRRPFWPRVSPRKTWEGTLAGVGAGALVGLAWAPALGWAPGLGLALGLAVAVAAIGGDLVESLLKRRAAVKDAGSLVPGHGGLLDRIDSLLFVTIVVFCSGVLDAPLGATRLGS